MLGALGQVEDRLEIDDLAACRPRVRVLPGKQLQIPQVAHPSAPFVHLFSPPSGLPEGKPAVHNDRPDGDAVRPKGRRRQRTVDTGRPPPCV